MRTDRGFRYALEHEDYEGIWKSRASADDRAIIMKMFRDTQAGSAAWRVLDRSTGTVLAGKGSI